MKSSHVSVNEGLDRLMGLVVALRFLLWGAASMVVTGLVFGLSFRYPLALKVAVAPLLLAIYLLTTGQILLLIRLYARSSKLLALAPFVSIVLLAVPQVRLSVRLSILVLFAGLWLYIESIARQAKDLEQDKISMLFQRLRQLLGPTIIIMMFLPDLAAPIATVAGPIFLFALTVGWRLWLNELRLTIASREDLQ